MKDTRNSTSNRGSLGTPKNLRTNSRRYSLTPKGRAWVLDHQTKLIRGVISEDANLPRPTAQSHVDLVNDEIDEFEQGQATPQRQKIDAIIAEIRAPKAAPAQCWDCKCTSIEVYTVGKNPPAYHCALCSLWLGNVNAEIDLKSELIRKHEELIWDLARIPLSDDTKFQETLETLRLIHSEILSMESK